MHLAHFKRIEAVDDFLAHHKIGKHHECLVLFSLQIEEEGGCQKTHALNIPKIRAQKSES